MPTEWIAFHYGDDAASRQAYVAGHDLEGLPTDFAGFLAFCTKRRQRIRARLAAAALGVESLN
jgi:hypothetical protein